MTNCGGKKKKEHHNAIKLPQVKVQERVRPESELLKITLQQ